MKMINSKDQGDISKECVISCSVIEPNYLGAYHTAFVTVPQK